jgi:phosphohistidine phosphatase SixA/CHAD domain-containing protein
MVSRLVLVRHAKTQARGDGFADEKRELTAAGKRSIEARYPCNLKLLFELDSNDVRIWSSPATRALQTAEVVARVLGIDGIETHEALYADAIDVFIEELAAAQGTVIAVGHNPFMEELYRRFSNTTQDMGTGAIASFAIQEADDDGEAMSAWLEWFVQAPRVALWQSLVDLDKGLIKAGENIEQRVEALLAQPDDPETLHQYRISIRVARSLMAFVYPFCKRGALKETMRQLKELQAPTSHLRELDMLADALEEGSPEAQMCEPLRAQERSGFIRELNKRTTRRQLKRVVSQLKDMPWRDSVEACGLDRRELAQCIQQMQTEYERKMNVLDYAEIETVHDVRKQAKALRYVTREFADCLPPEADKTNTEAKAVQDKLGELCDCRTNARLLVEICGPDAVETAARFVLRGNAIVAELEMRRTC